MVPNIKATKSPMDIYKKMQKPEKIKSNSENMLGKISTNENVGMSDDSGGGRRRRGARRA